MKKLERGEMKNLVGGVSASPVGPGWGVILGTRGSSSYGFCFCDVRWENGDVECEVQCPVQACDHFNEYGW